MNFNDKMLSCAMAKEIDMVDYLLSLGHEPARISRHHYWYLSPLRSERTASFKVNRNWNTWYDFGDGRGGTIIDFGILYFKCSIPEFLLKLSASSLEQQTVQIQTNRIKEDEETIHISEIKSIRSSALLCYLKQRKIDPDIALHWCKEITFTIYQKQYYAIGFPNDLNGYELRNEFFKGSTRPKGITTIDNKADTLYVFEGFFDFLSFQTMNKNSECITENFIVLNSLSFIESIKPLIPQYNSIKLFLDRDAKGQSCTGELIRLSSTITDASHLYHRHKDLNDWLMHFGLSGNLLPE